MLQQYHPELGEHANFKNTARYNPFLNKWAVRTKQELKGRGISFFEKSQANPEVNIYYVTQKAFDKLCELTNISQELLFD